MHLERQIGGACERRIVRQRGERFPRRAEMHIERGDIIFQRLARKPVALRAELRGLGRKPGAKRRASSLLSVTNAVREAIMRGATPAGSASR